MPYESGLKDLDVKEAAALHASWIQKKVEVPWSCIHVVHKKRVVHKTIRVRDSLRVMDLCKECFGAMERAGCIAEVL